MSLQTIFERSWGEQAEDGFLIFEPMIPSKQKPATPSRRVIGLTENSFRHSSYEATETLRDLENYLTRGAEMLTLDEYKELRRSVDKVYQPEMSQAIKNNLVSLEDAKRVGMLFTDYLRQEHYRLLDLPENERNLKQQGRYEIGIPRTRGVRSKEDDDNLYRLERLVWDPEKSFSNHSEERAQQIEEVSWSLSPFGLSFYKLRTLRRAVEKIADETIGLQDGTLKKFYRSALRKVNGLLRRD